MSNLFIIPARGGSERFKNKNIADLNGKPLIYYTLDVVTEFAHHADTIVFTTDSDEIMKIAEEHPHADEIKFEKRSQDLATNESKVIDTICYYFDTFKEGQYYSRVWQLLPTCPLRSILDMEKAIDSLTPYYDSVISITEYEFPPRLGLIRDPFNNLVTDCDESKPWQNGDTRSQDHPTIYRPNGAIYVMWANKFNEYRNFYKGNTMGYIMSREQSVDIDTEFDLKIAGVLLQEYC